MDQKGDAEVMPRTRHPGKTDVRYWMDVIFKRKREDQDDTD